jgi:deoxyribonuclease-4
MSGPGVTRPVGAHVPVAGGLARGLEYAAQSGAEAVQVFVANPRGWGLPDPDPRQDAAFRERASAAGLPVFVHASYLVNVASPDPLARERSIASLRYSLSRAAAIGARGVVVHTGSALGGDPGEALGRVREMLLPLLDSLAGQAPDLLLEPTAGQGSMLCGQISGLGPYLDALSWHPRAAICLDTCHLFAAGHDLTAPGAVDALLAGFAAVAGRDAGGAPVPAAGRLRLIHANDSRDGCGSRRDRHQNIGAGKIGTAAFARLLAHPATAGVPFVVETPGALPARTADIAILKRRRDQPGAPPARAPEPAREERS